LWATYEVAFSLGTSFEDITPLEDIGYGRMKTRLRFDDTIFNDLACQPHQWLLGAPLAGRMPISLYTN
jgi:hypothetical protein